MDPRSRSTSNDATEANHSVRRVRAAFILEQHLGHQTFADNLRAASASHSDVDATWIPIRYQQTGGWAERVPMPSGLRSVLRARAEIAAGLRTGPVDIRVFNTQVPAVIGPRAARARPYILITDVTPIQYNQMAEGYGHRDDKKRFVRDAKHAWNCRVIRGAVWNIGWSSWVRNSLMDDYGVDPDRAAVISPGVDTNRWTPSGVHRHDRIRILFVGADFERKGGGALLTAFAALPHDSAELVLVTRSPIEPRPSVSVIGDLGPNDPRLIDLFRTSDVFVLPSRSETFGIAAVEASAVGVPVIASAVGGLTDIVVDRQTGFTIQPGDPAELLDRLRALVGDPDLRRRFGAAARERAVERFDAPRNAARLLDLVRQCA
jgi:glycosyltransferase involved in cell wall biosynthesis